MHEPSRDDLGLGDDEINDFDIPRSLAGKALLDKLRLELDGVDFGMLKTVASSSGAATFQYRWCEPMKSFLKFLSRFLKMSAATSYHDAVKYLIFRMVLCGNAKTIEICHRFFKYHLKQPNAFSKRYKCFNFMFR